MPLPAIRIEPVADTAALDLAINEARRSAFDWCVFTSANAVEILTNRMDALDVHPNQLAGMRVAAVGRATAAAVADAGLNLTLIPESATGDALAATVCQAMRAGARVLYPRSATGREVLPNELRAAGFDVVTVDAYRTLPEPNVDQRVLERVRRGEVDLITFASPSSVRHVVALLGSDWVGLKTIPVVCAGPVTARAAQEAGLVVTMVSESPDAAAMSNAVAAFWREAGAGESLAGTATAPAGRSAG